MTLKRFFLFCFTSVSAFLVAGGSPMYAEAEKSLPEVKVPRVANVIAPSREALDEQIRKGVDFLLQSQNADGSWGDHGMTKGLNVMCPEPGGPIAFRAAVTALDVIGLSSCAPQDARVQLALDRAETWLLANLNKMRRTDTDTLLNVWAHSYGISALCALSQRVAPGSQTYTALKTECEHQLTLLDNMAYGGGGWGYYEFNSTSRRPNGNATSFTTSTVLIAMKEAEKTFGLKSNPTILKKSLKFLYDSRTPVGSYVYAQDHLRYPTGEINRHAGSLARTPAGNAALFLFNHKDISKQDVEDGLDWLWARGGWLDMARKKPVPHESFALNAGYFFYYGYFYAAESMNLLDEAKRARHASFMARVLLPLQEKDGSWWDYPLYNYHKPYGTGYALYSLSNARGALYGSKYAESSGELPPEVLSMPPVANPG